ncbi:ABC transporter permease subunit [Bacillus sp. FJAT-29814]|uniref:ABC transporter permease subunit n=1 Tax=Bacillus sp. FJAT-29814 TaxID=1729688 RepID=UPI00082DB78A|nr:ABC transporter permease subunit [Bacillus sp. FJAT-29814]
MILFLIKRKRFVISFLFLSILFCWSLFLDGEIRQVKFFYDEKGNLLDAPPYPPFTVFLFGSDKFGYDMGEMMIVGAKYTIGITLVVALLRLIVSLVFSSFMFSSKPAIFNGMKTVFEPFSVVPQTIIVFFILYSVLWMPMSGFATPFWERALFQTLILVIVAVPNVTIHLANDMRLVYNETFIEASKTLGAGKLRIFFNHIVPHVYEKWILLFGQQFIQTLQLMAHLGFMNLFFGGTNVPYGVLGDDGTPPRSLSYEWSGLIGSNISYLYAYQWMVLVPIAFFIMTAISVALINDSFKEYVQRKQKYEQLKG